MRIDDLIPRNNVQPKCYMNQSMYEILFFQARISDYSGFVRISLKLKNSWHKVDVVSLKIIL